MKLKKGHLEVTAQLLLERRKHVLRACACRLPRACLGPRWEPCVRRHAPTRRAEERLVHQECAAPAEQVGQVAAGAGGSRAGRRPTWPGTGWPGWASSGRLGIEEFQNGGAWRPSSPGWLRALSGWLTPPHTHRLVPWFWPQFLEWLWGAASPGLRWAWDFRVRPRPSVSPACWLGGGTDNISVLTVHMPGGVGSGSAAWDLRALSAGRGEGPRSPPRLRLGPRCRGRQAAGGRGLSRTGC